MRRLDENGGSRRQPNILHGNSLHHELWQWCISVFVKPTLVLSPQPSLDSQRLRRAAVNSGWQIERPGSASPLRRVTEPVIYGDAPFAHDAAEKLGVTLVEPAEDWLARVPENFLRREVCCTTLEDACELRSPAFVKPARGRAFPARVYSTGYELRVVALGLDPKMTVLVSDPVVFEVEYRTFVLKNRIAAASVYARRGGPERTDSFELTEAVLFAHEVVYRMADACPVAFVLDVGRIEGRGWAVVEADPCWGSGLFSCDETRVLEVLEHACTRLPS